MRFDLTDEEWATIEPLLPPRIRGPKRVDEGFTGRPQPHSRVSHKCYQPPYIVIYLETGFLDDANIWHRNRKASTNSDLVVVIDTQEWIDQRQAALIGGKGND